MTWLRRLIEKARIFKRLRALEALISRIGVCTDCGVAIDIDHAGTKLTKTKAGLQLRCPWCQQRLEAAHRGKRISRRKLMELADR